MIDFVKCIVKNVNLENIKNNTLLEFKSYLNEKTGELGLYSTAYYNGMKFKVYSSTRAYPFGRLTIEGSLHKYWNDGKHNFNDFGILEVEKVLKELFELFGIHSENCVLKQLELGVNLNPNVLSKIIIDNCFMYSTKRFGWQWTRDEGNYIQSVCDRKTFKIYDKAIHYRNKGFLIKNEILRVEVKYTKMQDLNRINIYTLSDLINFGLNDLVKNVLLKEWDKVLIYDKHILENHKNKKDYSNPKYWFELAETSSRKFKYHRNNLKSIYNENPNNLKNNMFKLIANKVDQLSTKTYQMHPLYTVCN